MLPRMRYTVHAAIVRKTSTRIVRFATFGIPVLYLCICTGYQRGFFPGFFGTPNIYNPKIWFILLQTN